MSKRIWTSLVLAVALAAPGCRMCCPSYDYCGPLDPAESNSESCGLARRGSAFSGYHGEEIIMPGGMEYETDPGTPMEPTKKKPGVEVNAPLQTQARPIPAPQREPSTTAAKPPAAKPSSRRSS